MLVIDKEELLFIVDENNNPLSPQPRSVAHKTGLWHRTSGVWIINHNKQILCQKRSLKKDVKPGMWEAFFGGHLSPSEGYLESAAKEAGEELGITVDKNKLIPYKIFKSDKPTHKEFQQVFGLVVENDQTQFPFEKDEIDELKWLPIEKVKEIIVDKKDPQWVQKFWDKEVLNWLDTLL